MLWMMGLWKYLIGCIFLLYWTSILHCWNLVHVVLGPLFLCARPISISPFHYSIRTEIYFPKPQWKRSQQPYSQSAWCTINIYNVDVCDYAVFHVFLLLVVSQPENLNVLVKREDAYVFSYHISFISFWNKYDLILMTFP